MSGFCNECGNTVCICPDIKKEQEVMMTHMNEKWEVSYDGDGRSSIQTVRSGFTICTLWGGLPYDVDGSQTARAICDTHNAALPKFSAEYISLLKNAMVWIDKPYKKGDICLGAYIKSYVNEFYGFTFLSVGKTWSTNLKPDFNFWATGEDASKFLQDCKKEVGL